MRHYMNDKQKMAAKIFMENSGWDGSYVLQFVEYFPPAYECGIVIAPEEVRIYARVNVSVFRGTWISRMVPSWMREVAAMQRRNQEIISQTIIN